MHSRWKYFAIFFKRKTKGHLGLYALGFVGTLLVFFKWPWGIATLVLISVFLCGIFKDRLWHDKTKILLKDAFNQAPYGIIFWDSDQNVVNANVIARSIMDGSLTGPTHLNALHSFFQDPEASQVFERLKIYTTHRQEGREWIEMHCDGSLFGIEIHVRPAGGSSMLWFLEKEMIPLSNSLESSLFRDFLEVIPSPLIVTTQYGRIRHANTAFLEWLNYEVDAVIQHPLQNFLETRVPISRQKKPRLLTFQSGSGHKKSGILSPTYSLGNKAQDLCLFVVPELVSTEDTLHLVGLLENIPLPAVFLDRRGLIRLTNRRFEKIVRDRKILGKSLKDWTDDNTNPKIDRFLQQVRRSKDQNHSLIIEFSSKSVSTIMRVYATYIPSSGWDPMGCFLVLFYDVTETQKREKQTLESQKLQALGQLAGGISHDFNNLLTAMLGFCDLLLQRHTPQDNSFSDIMQIKQNANRAANLIRQLLLFAKQSVPAPKPLDLRECLNEMSFLLRRLIGPKIELEIKHDRALRMIHADQGQFEQIIMNLAINARDAMPAGGSLTFRIKSTQTKDPLAFLHHKLPPKSYIVVEVSDTGCGIQEEHLEKIFTPFFSTKEPGSGTGLGLATVYQILEAMGGGIKVESQVGSGTLFTLFFPRHTERKKRDEEPVLSEESRGHLLDFWETAQILIVEDEDPVRLFASRALKSKGYEVFEAKDGPGGFEILQKTPHIKLLVTDVMMPGMDGPTLVNEAYALNPSLKVVFVSGYPEEDIQTKLRFPKEQVFFLPKPFNLSDLTVKVHEVLGS